MYRVRAYKYLNYRGGELNFKSGMLIGHSFTAEKYVYTFATVLKLFNKKELDTIRTVNSTVLMSYGYKNRCLQNELIGH